MSDEISIGDIREGDLIRIERDDPGPGSWIAEERRAQADGMLAFNPTGSYRVILLDRPAPQLPTRPYSLVVPRVGARMFNQAYILEPSVGGRRWFRSGVAVDREEVEAAVADGWVAIEAPEVIDR